MNQNSRSLSVGRRHLSVVQFTGTVAQATKNLETKVSGSGGGGFTYQGTGGNAPVSISSTTIVHDQIFLTNRDGEERAIKLAGFDVAVREGHLITALAINMAGIATASYAAVINHTTNEQYVQHSVVRDLVRMALLPVEIDRSTPIGMVKVVVLAGATAAFGVMTGGIGFLVPIYYEFMMVRPKAKEISGQLLQVEDSEMS